ncbi:hypothetical protein Efla_004639 [Eimeria flavescens]
MQQSALNHENQERAKISCGLPRNQHSAQGYSVFSVQGREETRQLQAEVREGAVFLSATKIEFARTFVNLTSQQVLSIENNTDEHLPFSWSFELPPKRVVSSTDGSDTMEEVESFPLVHFSSFSIKPRLGRVWAKSKRSVYVEFTPERARSYSAVVLCNIAGREKGLELHLQGVGTGPQAGFTADVIDFGEVVVHTKKSLDIDLVNTGDIAASFSMKPFSGLLSPGKELTFRPSTGNINVNKAEKLQATLCPTFLGDFEVNVLWSIEESPEDIVLTVKGTAIPPLIEHDVSSLDFGIIPFGFEEVRTLTLFNTSDAPQVITARVVKRNEETYDDISVIPQSVTIPARASQQVEVRLHPSKAQVYLEELAFDLAGLTANYLILPLRGSSKTPQVILEPESSIFFEDVFLNTPAEKVFKIINTSRLSAHFSVSSEVEVSATPLMGLVPPLEASEVSVQLHPLAPGEIRAKCIVSIAGIDAPFELQLCACASGPRLRVEPRDLHWGKIACLEEAVQILEVTNISPIPAAIRCSVKGKHGYFVPQNPQMTLEGGASTEIRVAAIFTEPVAASDQLVISVADGPDTVVTLKGQAVGSPVVMKSFDASIDFKQVCTSVAKFWPFTVTNRGTRLRHVTFVDGSRNSAGRQLKATQPKFSVEPSNFALGPNASKTVRSALVSLEACNIRKALLRQDLGVFVFEHMIDPHCRHMWKPGQGAELLLQELEIINVSPISLRCKAKASSPFTVEPQYFSVGPHEATSLSVSFNAYFNGRHSSQIKGSLDITFKEHPRAEVFPLEATTEFPNIELETTLVDFGYIANETTKRIPLRIKNISCVRVTYGWYLSEECEVKEIEGENFTPGSSNALAGNLSSTGELPIPLNKVFDFTPFTGTLDPGAYETVHIRYWGLPNLEISTVAICSIDHGPDYSVRLVGRASHPRFRVNQSEFNFGEVPYLKPVSAEVHLVNFGLVDLGFAIDLSRVTFPWTTSVSKREGMVKAHEKLKLDLIFMAGIPTDFYEHIVLEADHHDPISITLRGRGTYPCLLMSLPRCDEVKPSAEGRQTALDAPEDESAWGSWTDQAQIDRQNLCNIMLEHYRTALSVASGSSRYGEDAVDISKPREHDETFPSLSSCSSLMSEFSGHHRLAREPPPLVATPGKYALDFGSVVVGHLKTKVVQLRNASPLAFSLKIDKKGLGGSGFSVEPDVIHRVQPKEQLAMAFSAKHEWEKEAIFPLTIWVSSSVTYKIDLKAKFVIPDLVFSADKLEFGEVWRGFRKTLRLRLRNEKSVPARWRYRTILEKGDKAQSEALQCFVVEPKHSLIAPGEWVDVKVHFYAEKAEGEMCARLVFCLDDNPKWKCILAKGAPKIPRLEFIPPVVDLGHCLPSHTLRQEVILRNNSDTPCEVYSLEFDDHYKQTEALLRVYDGFDESGIALLPVRPRGKTCWSRVVRSAMRKAATGGQLMPESPVAPVKAEEAHRVIPKTQLLTSMADEEEFKAFESSSEESADELPQEVPHRVLPPHRQSAIILGPTSCGKRQVAVHVGSPLRRVLTLDDCVEWILASSGRKKVLASAGSNVYRQVEELIRHIEAQEADGDIIGSKRSEQLHSHTFMGKARAGKYDRQGLGPGAPLHLLIAAIRLRTLQQDCYAGTVFVVEPSTYCPSASDGAIAILRALEDEDISVVIIKFGQPQSVSQDADMASSHVVDGVAYYRALVAKHLQREREIAELLDAKGQELTESFRAGSPAIAADLKKKKAASGLEGEGRPAALPLGEDIERLREELQFLQQGRLRIEANLSTTKAAYAFVQDQIAAYCMAESEVLKQLKDNGTFPAFHSCSSGSTRRASNRQSLERTGRTIAVSVAYVNPSLPIESLFGQLQPLRSPVIPTEPPIPNSEVVEVVHYPEALPVVEPPAHILLLSPLITSGAEKLEEEETKNRSKKTRDTTPSSVMRSKVKQERGMEDEGSAARLAVEPGFTSAARWILEPHSEQRLLIKYLADEEGDYACTLHFRAVGDITTFELKAKATCCIPQLANFPHGCFLCAQEDRGDNQLLKKTYVVNERRFEWGPLLNGRSATVVKSLYSKGTASEELQSLAIPQELADFMTPLILRNASPFNTMVKGSFAGGLGLEGADATRGRKLAKSQAMEPPFLLFPSELMLAKNSTAQMHLWCLPKYEGEIADKLVLSLSENPHPYEVKISSCCVSPKINVQPENITFGRILTATSAKRTIQIENPTPFPLKWNFASQEPSNKCFAFSPERGGILEPFCKQKLEVEYEASVKPSTAQCRLAFKCMDVEGISISSETKTVSVSAEAFSIECGLDLPSKPHVLDFGKVQACQEAEVSFNLYNKGKYPVRFEIDTSSPKLRSILTLEPSSGELRPGEQRKGVARLCVKRDVEIMGEEIPIIIRDAETGIAMEPSPPSMHVMATVAFNEISLSPPRGLNFGAVESGKTSQLPFELGNKGKFCFEWYLVNAECMFSPVEEALRPPDSTQKMDKPRHGKPKPQPKSSDKPSSAAFGPFKIFPVRGQLEPGGTVTIQAEYNAQGDASHALSLALLVNGVKVGQGEDFCVSSVGAVAAFSAEPAGTAHLDAQEMPRPAATYFLQGQSSVPCISLEPDALFHEQMFVPSMEDALAVWRRRRTTVFVEDESSLCFGPVLVGSPGILETIRVDNPQLVPAEIVLEIKQNVKSPHDKNATSDEAAFDVQPKRIFVAPHDHAYATVTFRPTSLQQYFSCLRIYVEKAASSIAGQAQFDLRGEGTLPSLTLTFPSSQKSPGTRSHGTFFDFGRIATFRAVTIPIMVKNEGAVPATGRAELPACPSIDFDLPSLLTLQPHEERTFALTYHPRAPGELDYKFCFCTHFNPFENMEFQFKGAAYSEELVWSLPASEHANDLESDTNELTEGNNLILNDVPLGEVATQTLVLRNRSAQNILFELSALSLGPLKDALSVTPASGSVPASSACLINVSFKSDEPLSVSRHALTFSTFSTRSSSAGAAAPKLPQKIKGKAKPKQGDVKPDAAIIERADVNPPEDLFLYVTAATDMRRCELSISSIDFEATALFRTRVFSFTINNMSVVTVPFELFFEKNDKRDEPCFYELSIDRGQIPAGKQQQVQLKFAPVNISEFQRVLVCRFPNFHQGYSNIQVRVSASAIRPICHLEVPPTDYLERRPQKFVTALDDNVAVLELEGVGVGVCYTRRVVVHNPTAKDLEFECEAADVKLVDADSTGNGGLSKQPFRCLTRRGKILAGKKTEVAFEYIPTRLGICEQLWTFSIPTRQLVQTLLLVGRATEPHVTFEKTHLSFQPSIVGRIVEQDVRLQNWECIPMSFHFDGAHLEAAGSEIRITPQMGILAPERSALIHVQLNLKEEKKFSASIPCRIAQKFKPLRLNIKGESYHLMPFLKVENKDGERLLIHGMEEISFGCLLAGQTKQVTLKLGNEGKFDFNFRWTLGPPTNDSSARRFHICPANGSVPRGQHVDCVATYTPDTTASMDSLQAVCDVQGQKFWALLLTGSCKIPNVKFSFTAYDFGSFPVAPLAGTTYDTQASGPQVSGKVILIIKNTDVHHECVVATRAEPTGVFDFRPVQVCLSPEEALEFPITFTPQKAMQYKTSIPFVVNERLMTTLELTGKGFPIRLDVQPIESGVIKLPPVLRGKGSSRTIRIFNRSEKALSFFLESPEGQLR